MRSTDILARLLRSALLTAIAASLFASALRAQDNPKAIIDQDCRAFDISSHNDIVYAVPHRKFIKKYIVNRDDIFIATNNGKINRIVDADKFIPAPPLEGFVVNSLSWSPDGKRIAVNMTLQPLPARLEEQLEEKKNKHKDKKKHDDSSDDDDDNNDYQPPKPALGGRAVALFDDQGREIQVAGAKSQFINEASDATWLAADQYVVYRSGDQIMRVRPADGATTKLFEGHSFQAIAWDAPRNRAFAIGEDLTPQGGLALVELDLLQQRIAPIAQLTSYRSALTISSSGKKVGFFANGDTIEVIDVANPSKPVRVNAGLGFFQFGPTERRVLLKRGPEGQSNDLVWVGLHDDGFTPALHDLEYHAFQIAPDGNSVAVTEPGKRVLKIFSLD
ncbi:MAG: hypothetical protein ACRD4R_08215 [Candidatus Acidiferrales bacterium]